MNMGWGTPAVSSALILGGNGARHRNLILEVQADGLGAPGYYEEARRATWSCSVAPHAASCAESSARPARSAPRGLGVVRRERKGVIYSYEIVTQAIQPAFADWVPYPVVLVELDEHGG